MEKLSRYLTILLKITMLLGILITVFVSKILSFYFSRYFIVDVKYYIACVILITLSGVFAVYILYQLIKVMKTINEKDPFIEKNVNCLKKIGISSFIISLNFFILMFFRSSVFTFVISYTFIIAGFSFIVFSGLIKKAKEYKDENDLTV